VTGDFQAATLTTATAFNREVWTYAVAPRSEPRSDVMTDTQPNVAGWKAPICQKEQIALISKVKESIIQDYQYLLIVHVKLEVQVTLQW